MVDMKRRVDPDQGAAALARVRADHDAGREADRADLAMACRFLLEELASAAPGRSVEVRVPPYAVGQCVAGPRHTRGTPPNVVETDPVTWVALATGALDWRTAVVDARLVASGDRSDLSPYLPVVDP